MPNMTKHPYDWQKTSKENQHDLNKRKQSPPTVHNPVRRHKPQPLAGIGRGGTDGILASRIIGSHLSIMCSSTIGLNSWLLTVWRCVHRSFMLLTGATKEFTWLGGWSLLKVDHNWAHLYQQQCRFWVSNYGCYSAQESTLAILHHPGVQLIAH